jgi:flagellar motor protein MotB
LVAVQRQQTAALTTAQAEANQARQQANAAQQAAANAQADAQAQAQANAQAQIQQARQEAQAANQRANALEQQADADRAALIQAQNDPAQARQRAQQAEIAAAQIRPDPAGEANRASAIRVRLLGDLNRVMPATDTPRGLVVTIAGSDFSGDSVRGTAAERLAHLAALVSSQPGLHVTVEGYADRASQQEVSETRAFAVRRVLTNNGLSAATIFARGMGDARPLGPAGDPENSRVEIVIAGDPIGTVPSWDRTYPLSSNR